MSNHRYDSTKQWYAIHTYSGYEEKVAEAIRQRADTLDMSDKIFQVLVPKEKQKDLLYFSWDPGKYVANRGRKYKEWLKEFKMLGVPTRNDSYWLNGIVILFICTMLWIALCLTHLL